VEKRLKMKKRNYIKENFYKKFIQNMPLCCVDLVVKNNDRFLLVRRKQSPAKNKWWLIGGRLFLNENLIVAAKRKLKEELGLKKIKLLKLLGVGETKFKKGRFESPIHSVNIVFLAEIDNLQVKSIKLDLINHFGYKWQKNVPKGSSPYLKKFLRLSGFK
jgi:ADP-ribose pyrophosphatase YjhB (NUDIX family)